MVAGGSEKETRPKGSGGNYRTSAKIVELIARVVPIHVQLAAVPAHARNAAVRETRARTERDVFEVEVLASTLPEIEEFEDETLEESDARDTFRLELIGREIFVFLVGFDAVTDVDSVISGGFAVVFGHRLVEVVRVAPGFRSLGEFIENEVDRETLGDYNQPAEAVTLGRDLEIGKMYDTL